MVRLAWLPLLAFTATAAALQPGTVAIDSQEWVDQPAKHLRIEGTLNGDTPFYVLLPPKSAWKGRLIHWLSGGLGGR